MHNHHHFGSTSTRVRRRPVGRNDRVPLASAAQLKKLRPIPTYSAVASIAAWRLLTLLEEEGRYTPDYSFLAYRVSADGSSVWKWQVSREGALPLSICINSG